MSISKRLWKTTGKSSSKEVYLTVTNRERESTVLIGRVATCNCTLDVVLLYAIQVFCTLLHVHTYTILQDYSFYTHLFFNTECLLTGV